MKNTKVWSTVFTVISIIMLVVFIVMIVATVAYMKQTVAQYGMTLSSAYGVTGIIQSLAGSTLQYLVYALLLFGFAVVLKNMKVEAPAAAEVPELEDPLKDAVEEVPALEESLEEKTEEAAEETEEIAEEAEVTVETAPEEAEKKEEI